MVKTSLFAESVMSRLSPFGEIATDFGTGACVRL
jgi:hypothetical protein